MAFEKYWRNVAIRNRSTPQGNEYVVTYLRNFFSRELINDSYSSRLEVIKALRRFPHRKRYYYGFDFDFEHDLEHKIKKARRKS